MHKNIMLSLLLVSFVYTINAADKAATSIVNMNTIVRIPSEQTIKARLKQADLEMFEKEACISSALTDKDEEITVSYVVTTIKHALHSYKTSNRSPLERTPAPEGLVFKVVLQDDPIVLKFLKKQKLIK